MYPCLVLMPVQKLSTTKINSLVSGLAVITDVCFLFIIRILVVALMAWVGIPSLLSL